MYITEGLILKKIDAGEADAFFIVYTKDFGKIRALAQGIKKEGAKLKGHLELLNLTSIGFVLGKNGERLTRAQIINSWPEIRNDSDKLKTALFMVGFVDRYCLVGEKDEKLWGLLINSFGELGQKEFSAQFIKRFEKQFLAALGYGGISDFAVLNYN